MAFLFAPAILPAFTFQWLEHTKTHPGIFFFLQTLVGFGLMTHTHSNSKQVLSLHYEGYKSSCIKLPAITGTLKVPRARPERLPGRQAENEFTPP